jgi:hypothetical protein
MKVSASPIEGFLAGPPAAQPGFHLIYLILFINLFQLVYCPSAMIDIPSKTYNKAVNYQEQANKLSHLG